MLLASGFYAQKRNAIANGWLHTTRKRNYQDGQRGSKFVDSYFLVETNEDALFVATFNRSVNDVS